MLPIEDVHFQVMPLLPPPCCAAATGGMVGGSPLRRGALSSAPRLPNGSLPAAAAMASPAPALSTFSIVDSIRKACLEAEVPAELRGHPEFAFLAEA